MALIKCPECGKKISDKSTMCIHCGCPLDKISEPICTPTQVDSTEEIVASDDIQHHEKHYFLILACKLLFCASIYVEITSIFGYSDIPILLISSLLLILEFLYLVFAYPQYIHGSKITSGLLAVTEILYGIGMILSATTLKGQILLPIMCASNALVWFAITKKLAGKPIQCFEKLKILYIIVPILKPTLFMFVNIDLGGIAMWACAAISCALVGYMVGYDKIKTSHSDAEVHKHKITSLASFMLVVFFPVGFALTWKNKCFKKVTRVISTIISFVWFVIFVVFVVALIMPCEHVWVDATCTTPKYCEICNETEGSALGHINWIDATCTEPKRCESCSETEGSALGHEKSDWTLTKQATLTDVGVEEILCNVCGESLDSRGTERKNPKIIGNTFNFTDEELIDWANSWLNGTYEIEDYGHFDLGNDILGYRVETDDGEDGMLLLKHDGGDEVSAIMVYFDNFVDRSALALFFGTKINSQFIYDDAALILANNSTYFAADMIATNLTIDDGLEVALLTPESYMYKIISGTTLTPSDCYISIENNEAIYEKYNNNMWDLICEEYGENRSYWFWVDNFDDDLHSGLGEITTYRGITLGVSTEKDITTAYGYDMEFSFDKNTDDLYRSMRAGGFSNYKFLENTKKVLVYDYKGQFQIAFYIDSTGIVDCIAYFDGEWYGD